MSDSVSETHESAHDPLCHEAWDHEFTDDQPCGICAAIAKGREDMLAKCIAEVEGIKSIYVPKDSTALQELNIKIISTLRALQEKI